MVSTAFTHGTESHLKAPAPGQIAEASFFLVRLSAAKAAVSLKKDGFGTHSIPKTKLGALPTGFILFSPIRLLLWNHYASFQSNSLRFIIVVKQVGRSNCTEKLKIGEGNSGIIVGEDFLITFTGSRHLICAVLAHTNAVSQTACGKGIAVSSALYCTVKFA